MSLKEDKRQHQVFINLPCLIPQDSYSAHVLMKNYEHITLEGQSSITTKLGGFQRLNYFPLLVQIRLTATAQNISF